MSSEAQDDRLLELAGEIADGRPVDWDREGAPGSGLEKSVDALRILETVVVAHAAMPDGPSLAPGSMWGPLKILERIGCGTYGEVYRVFEPTLRREVALKLLHSSRCANPDEVRLFLNEARRLAGVRHNNVLTVHGADVHDGRAGMWTDLIRGETLEALIASKGPLSAHEAALVGIDLCRALAALHASDLIHRDVKTHNVMREEKGRIVLMDFGSVGEMSPCPAEASADAPQGAEDEVVRSTPLSAAPELLRSEPATRASDVYSLGVLLYRLTTGGYPYEAGDLDELTRKHEEGDDRPLREARPDLPVDFVQAVERALQLDPAQRYPGCAAMERALVGCLGSEARVPPDPSAGGMDARNPETPRPGAKTRGWAGVAVVAACAAIVIALVLRRGEDAKPAAPLLASEEEGPAPERASPVTVAPAPAPAPAAAPLPPLTATASLFRQVGADGEPLPQNARVSAGDGLYLEVEGPERMHVYVLNEDALGTLYVLFPLPGFDASNPLRGGSRHRLPGRRDEATEVWEVSSAGGAEDLLVLASRRPIEHLERELAHVPRASADEPFQYPEVSEETAVRLRSIGRTRPVEEIAPRTEPGRLSEILASISRSPHSNLRDIWMWQTRLYNPATSP